MRIWKSHYNDRYVSNNIRPTSSQTVNVKSVRLQEYRLSHSKADTYADRDDAAPGESLCVGHVRRDRQTDRQTQGRIKTNSGLMLQQWRRVD